MQPQGITKIEFNCENKDNNKELLYSTFTKLLGSPREFDVIGRQTRITKLNIAMTLMSHMGSYVNNNQNKLYSELFISEMLKKQSDIDNNNEKLLKFSINKIIDKCTVDRTISTVTTHLRAINNKIKDKKGTYYILVAN